MHIINWGTRKSYYLFHTNHTLGTLDFAGSEYWTPFNNLLRAQLWHFSNDPGNTGLEIATDTVANATNIFSLATKNSSLVAKVATRFLYDLDLK